MIASFIGLPQNEFLIVGGAITNHSPMATNVNAPNSIKTIFDLLSGISIRCSEGIIINCQSKNYLKIVWCRFSHDDQRQGFAFGGYWENVQPGTEAD